mgnify:CR=1 FL=1
MGKSADVRPASGDTPAMASLRATIGNALPPRLANRARSLVRGLDQLAGLPLAPLRPGAVCMFHTGRCGSSVLGGLLDQHPRVRWDREIYFHRWTAGDRTFAPWDSRGFLRRRMWAAGRRWYGYEMKFLAAQHLAIVGRTLPEYVAEARAAGVTHFLVLERRNALRRLVSEYAGRVTKTRHAAADAAATGPTRVTLDVERAYVWRGRPPGPLVAHLDEYAAAHRELLALLRDDRHLHLTFEDDVAAAGPEAAYARVCAFLGIAPAPARPHTRRLAPQPLSELVANFDEVARALAATPHAWMLEA